MKAKDCKQLIGLIISFIMGSVLLSCNDTYENENLYQYENQEISITGSILHQFNDEYSSGNARLIDYTVLPEYSTISIYCKGGIYANGEILTLNGNIWKGMPEKSWNNNYNEAQICAFFPSFNKDESIREYLYNKENGLNDILYCFMDISKTNNIKLKFSHLFSKVSISVDGNINSQLESLIINIPYIISGLDMNTGKTEIIKSDINHVSLRKQDNGIYEFIIPSGVSMPITIQLIGKENKEIYYGHIQEKVFEKGNCYRINIRSRESGIYTSEDFIAFTHLINGYEYENRRLDEFFKIENGKRVFNLFSNITLSDKDCKKIKQIGIVNEKNKYGFNDIFNGNKKTLKGFTINSDEEMNFYALFNTVGPDGIINDLFLDDFKINISKEYKEMKLSSLVGNNYGMIDKCRTINMSISESNNNVNIGGLVFENNGTVLNSKIENINITGGNFTIGVLSYINKKEIINNLVLTKDIQISKSNKNSAICIYNSGKIYNILVKNLINRNFYGTGYENETGIYHNCQVSFLYYNVNIPNTPQKHVIRFDHRMYTNYCDVIDFLNKWVKYESKKIFPNYKLLLWAKMSKSEFDKDI